MKWPAWLAWYKRPDYRDIREYSQVVGSGKRSRSPNERNVSRHLKLEMVLDNRTCRPMSLFDFYMYLKHMEFSEENLEFYVWHQDYVQSYDAGAASRASPGCSPVEKAPVPPPDHEAAERVVARIAQLISSEAACQPGSDCRLMRLKSPGKKSNTLHTQASDSSATMAELVDAGHRMELHAIAQTYLVPGAPKELNIPPAMRSRALASIQTSSDPARLRPIAEHVFQLLRNCSHRNFVRLGVSNGTFETLCLATGSGILLILCGFVAVLLLAFAPHRGLRSRWVVFGAWPLWWLGVSLVMAGLRGNCFFQLLFARRQPLPWERFADAEAAAAKPTGLVRVLSRLMIFDRKLGVQDVHLRRLQRQIVVQSLLGGAFFATCASLFFVLWPIWNFGV